jgi:ABC-type lipoprotein export system ATPase subunit
MITLSHVSKSYSSGKDAVVVAVQDVNLSIERAEFVIVTGRSGSGKTTLLNLIAGLTTPTSGTILLEDVDLWQISDQERSLLRNQKIGFIFQFPSLLPSLTALENVVLPTVFGDQGPKEEADERARRLLHVVGLDDKLSAYPRQLSAGQQQRVVIARALINEPQFLLADEPTSNLDEQTEQEIMALLTRVHQTTGVTVLLVSHTRELAHFGTRPIEMANGRILS